MFFGQWKICLQKVFKKNSKKYLTNRKICDIILKLLRITVAVTEKLKKIFLKKIQKRLDKLKEM